MNLILIRDWRACSISLVQLFKICAAHDYFITHEALICGSSLTNKKRQESVDLLSYII